MRLVKLKRPHKSLFPGETGGFSDEEAARLVAAGDGAYADVGERSAEPVPAQHAPAAALVLDEPTSGPVSETKEEPERVKSSKPHRPAKKR